jgi:hypothetical protein
VEEGGIVFLEAWRVFREMKLQEFCQEEMGEERNPLPATTWRCVRHYMGHSCWQFLENFSVKFFCGTEAP